MKSVLVLVAAVLAAAAAPAQTYPGNGSDVATEVAVNGAVQPALPGVHVVNPADVVVFTFTSPGDTLTGEPFVAFWQAFSTGSPPLPDPTLGVFFGPTLVGGIIADGFSNPSQIFNPVLDGFIAGGVIPPPLGGTNTSLLVNCLTIDLSQPLTIGVADAREIRIN